MISRSPRVFAAVAPTRKMMMISNDIFVVGFPSLADDAEEDDAKEKT